MLHFHQNNVITDLANIFPRDHASFPFRTEHPPQSRSLAAGNNQRLDTGACIQRKVDRSPQSSSIANIDDILLPELGIIHKIAPLSYSMQRTGFAFLLRTIVISFSFSFDIRAAIAEKYCDTSKQLFLHNHVPDYLIFPEYSRIRNVFLHFFRSALHISILSLRSFSICVSKIALFSAIIGLFVDFPFLIVDIKSLRIPGQNPIMYPLR